MNGSLANLSVAQLRRAAAIKEQIEGLQKELQSLLGTPAAPEPKRKRRKMSAAARARISAFQKARWAKIKQAQQLAAKKK